MSWRVPRIFHTNEKYPFTRWRNYFRSQVYRWLLRAGYIRCYKCGIVKPARECQKTLYNRICLECKRNEQRMRRAKLRQASSNYKGQQRT